MDTRCSAEWFRKYTMFGRVVQEGRQLNEVFADYLAMLYPVK